MCNLYWTWTSLPPVHEDDIPFYSVLFTQLRLFLGYGCVYGDLIKTGGIRFQLHFILGYKTTNFLLNALEPS